MHAQLSLNNDFKVIQRRNGSPSNKLNWSTRYTNGGGDKSSHHIHKLTWNGSYTWNIKAKVIKFLEDYIKENVCDFDLLRQKYTHHNRKKC